MKYLIVGFGILIVSIGISLITNDWSLLYKITGIVGLVCLALGGLLSGAFVSGDRLGRNLNSESDSDRRDRLAITNRIVLIGIPNIVFAIILLYILK